MATGGLFSAKKVADTMSNKITQLNHGQGFTANIVAIFGLLWGTVIVSFASTMGATIAFLGSRFLLRDMVQEQFDDKLKVSKEMVPFICLHCTWFRCSPFSSSTPSWA